MFTVNVFALSKSATVSNYAHSETNYYGFRGDAAGCEAKYNEFNSYPNDLVDKTGNASAEQACYDVNPDLDRLKLKSVIATNDYSGSPHCTVAYDNDADRNNGIASYNLNFVIDTSLQCTYQCKSIPQPADSPDAVWNEAECRWDVPCTIPDTYHIAKALNTTDMNYCQSEISNLQSLYVNRQGHLFCYGCPNSLGQTILDIYQDITANDACPSGTTQFSIQKNGTTIVLCDTDSNNDGTPDSLEPKCPNGQFMDVNGTCVDLSLPADFPKDSDDKGVSSIREDSNFNASTCIPGKTFNSGIAFAKIIGWNSETNKCEIGAFFCNNGLTWDNLDHTCKIPSDNLSFDPTKGEISQELADACTSGNWAKKWTLDYCGQPLCYIALSDQNYNLRCGNKYLEYDCTSDYRIKKYVQVSCGDPSKEDYDSHTIDLGGATSDGSGTVDNNTSTPGDGSTSDYVPDLNTTSSNLDIVSAINSGSASTTSAITSLDNHVLGLKNNLGSIDAKVSDISSAVGSINGALHAGDDKIGELDALSNSNGDGSLDDFFDNIKDSFGIVKGQFNELSGLVNSGFKYSPPSDGCFDPTASIYGKSLKLNICEPLSKFRPFVYFISVLGFTWLGIKIFILGFAL